MPKQRSSEWLVAFLLPDPCLAQHSCEDEISLFQGAVAHCSTPEMLASCYPWLEACVTNVLVCDLQWGVQRRNIQEGYRGSLNTLSLLDSTFVGIIFSMFSLIREGEEQRGPDQTDLEPCFMLPPNKQGICFRQHNQLFTLRVKQKTLERGKAKL